MIRYYSSMVKVDISTLLSDNAHDSDLKTLNSVGNDGWIHVVRKPSWHNKDAFLLKASSFKSARVFSLIPIKLMALDIAKDILNSFCIISLKEKGHRVRSPLPLIV